MRQLIINEPFQMVEREVDKPSIEGSHDVLLKITHIGVCGTDTHALQANSHSLVIHVC